MNKEYISVSQLNKYIKKIMDKDPNLNTIYLKGEISNFKAYRSGHYYFSLKDEESRIKGVMFKSYAQKLEFLPKDGMNVLVRGKVSVYTVNGDYQIYVKKMVEDGIGNLYIAFEQLKNKLEKEGLFRKEIKKSIPKFPKRIGVVTAPTGAVIKDIISTTKRRWPLCEIILFPSKVQGNQAAQEIVNQIKASEKYDLDLLIIGRGGRSIEDLWSFNEEIVARAIYDYKKPVISAVGHEVDYTIADFVADLRAETPTAAAEQAVPDLKEIKTKLNNFETRSEKAIKNKLEIYKQKLEHISSKSFFSNPEDIYQIKSMKFDEVVRKLEFNAKNLIYKNKNKIDTLKNSFIFKQPHKILDNKRFELNEYINKLEILNPLSTLKRGYTLTKKNNKVIGSSKDLKKGDELEIEFKDGNINTKVI